ncbi:MAG: hypothetical protein SGJ11_01815 [Phycisphaerae bacterium]|nr:hypothetical protein [Phycisphaerae bacterium]
MVSFPRAAWLVAAIVLSAGQASASPQGAPPVPRPDAAPDVGPAVAADSEWLEVEGLGLRIKPPQPAFGKSETIDGVLRYEIVDGQPSPRWWLRFQSLTSSRPGLTAADQLDAYLDVLTKNNKEFTVRVDEPLLPAGASGEGRLVIIESTISEGMTGMSGWAIIPTGPDRFIVCSLIATAANYGTTLPSLKRALRSMQLTSLATIERERRERIARGEAILKFPPATLRSAVQPTPLLFRMYRPGVKGDGSDETELGWMTVRATEGMRGEVDSSRKIETLKGDDLEVGLLVVLQAKMILGGDLTHMLDSETRFWVAWDRSSEVWSARNTQRQKNVTRTSGETGLRTPARAGDPRPALRVFQSSADQRTREPLEWQVPPNYLSQAELLILGRLLPKSDPAPAVFASYAFDPKTSSLPQRLDSWKRNDDGTWTLETRIGGAATPLVQTFDSSGDRLRRIDVDPTGTLITERIELGRLRSLWKRKGLPIE